MNKYNIEFMACFDVTAKNEEEAVEKFDEQLSFESAKVTLLKKGISKKDELR